MSSPGIGFRSASHRAAISTIGAVFCVATILALPGSSQAAPRAISASAAPIRLVAASSAGCMSKVTNLVAHHVAARSQDWYPAAQTNPPSVAGKTYYLVTLNSAVPQVAQFAAGFSAAASALGAKAVIFDGKGEPTVWSQGIEAAIAAHASGIVLSALSASAIAPALKQAAAAHIPVINAESGAPYPPFLAGVTASTSQNGTTLGSWLADAALDATHCDLHAVYPDADDVQISNQILSSMQAEIKKLCPSCELTQVPYSLNDLIGGQLKTKAQDALEYDAGANGIEVTADSDIGLVIAPVVDS